MTRKRRPIDLFRWTTEIVVEMEPCCLFQSLLVSVIVDDGLLNRALWQGPPAETKGGGQKEEMKFSHLLSFDIIHGSLSDGKKAGTRQVEGGTRGEFVLPFFKGQSAKCPCARVAVSARDKCRCRLRALPGNRHALPVTEWVLIPTMSHSAEKWLAAWGL